MPKSSSKNLEKTVSRLSLSLVIIVFAIKVSVSFFTNSLSFLSELIDSISDFFVVGITYISLKKGKKPADLDHMFGHYKFNSFAGLIESIFTMGIYIFVLYQSIKVLIGIFSFDEVYFVLNPLVPAISLLAIIIANIIINRIIVRIGKQTNNPAIKAQATNFSGDLLRNVAVTIGLIIAQFGYYFIDPLLAAIFSVKIFFESVGIIRQSYNELMDYNPISKSSIEQLKEKIRTIDSINKIENIAIRAAGNRLYIDLEIGLDPNKTMYSISEIKGIVKSYISEMFQDYECNVNLLSELDTDQYIKEKYWEVFEIIKESTSNFKELNDVHSISLDVMDDLLLIQLHIRMDPSASVMFAHQILSKFEEEVLGRISNRFPSFKNRIQIVSHLEPYITLEKIHRHGKPTEISNHIWEILKNETQKISEIVSFEIINILEENDGIHLYCKVKLNSKMSVQQAHEIITKFEFSLRGAVPEINKCIFHTEPDI